MIQQEILPVVSDGKAIEAYLKTNYNYVVIMHFQVHLLPKICHMLHGRGRKVIVHGDLIKGLKSDPAGARYLVETCHVEGVISTSGAMIQEAKKLGVISIQRLFLIDSRSLEKSMAVIKKTQPDYIELLPAIAFSIVPKIQAHIDIPIIGGGLLDSRDLVEEGLEAGFKAVTMSQFDLMATKD